MECRGVGGYWTRRQFLRGAGAGGLGLLTGCGRLPWQASPPPRVYRLGWLAPGPPSSDYSAMREVFSQALQELGYVDGQNFVVEQRFAEGQLPRLPVLAAELVALPVDAIVTIGVGTAEAARDATRSTPVVMIYPGDPVANGIVASLRRSGNNLTGLTEMHAQLNSKKLELLQALVPGLEQVAVFGNSHRASIPSPSMPSIEVAAEALGVQLQRLEIRGPGDLPLAFSAARQAGAEAVFLETGGGFRSPEFASRIVALAAEHQLPAMYPFPEWVERGGLVAYGVDRAAQYRRAAVFVDKILKGTKPAELPVEQPMLFELALNRRTAEALGLSIPYHVALQVTRVVE